MYLFNIFYLIPLNILKATERFSNMITFDIDGDGLREIIIVAEKEEEIHILEFSGGSLQNQTPEDGIDFITLNHASGTDAGEIVIKCSSTQRCLMAYSDNIDTGVTSFPQTNNYFGAFFNSSQEGIATSREVNVQTSTGFSAFCPYTSSCKKFS